MEVKTGYKKTEVGTIPEQWDAKPLESVLSRGRLGGNYPNQDTETEFPLMKMGNIARGHFDVSKVNFVVPGVTPEDEHRLSYGDVLFNTRNTLELVGKVAVWRDELPAAYYNSNLMRLEFDASEISSNEYVNYALNSAGSVARLRALATGTTSVAAIYTRDLLGMYLAVPPKPEQGAIARVLSDVDALLGALDRLISKKRDLRLAVMQHLLSGQTRLPGFSGEWETVNARNVGTIRGGTGFPLEAQGQANQDYPFFKVSDMSVEGNETFMVTANHCVSEDTRSRLGATAYPAGSIVFAKVGAAVFLERKRILTQPSCIDNNMAAFVLDTDRIDVRFMHFLLQATRLSEFVATTALPALNAKQLGAMVLKVPALAEQRAIAAALADVDSEIVALTGRRRKTENLKLAMMQELLTGRTRLVSKGGSHA